MDLVPCCPVSQCYLKSIQLEILGTALSIAGEWRLQVDLLEQAFAEQIKFTLVNAASAERYNFRNSDLFFLITDFKIEQNQKYQNQTFWTHSTYTYVKTCYYKVL